MDATLLQYGAIGAMLIYFSGKIRVLLKCIKILYRE